MAAALTLGGIFLFLFLFFVFWKLAAGSLFCEPMSCQWRSLLAPGEGYSVATLEIVLFALFVSLAIALVASLGGGGSTSTGTSSGEVGISFGLGLALEGVRDIAGSTGTLLRLRLGIAFGFGIGPASVRVTCST